MQIYKVGIDIGSTTAKIAVIDNKGNLIHQNYRRHKADVQSALAGILDDLKEVLGEQSFHLAITGSVGLGVSEKFDIPFIQEVVAASDFARTRYPQVSTLIDIGGEDAKIVYLENGRVKDLRMNGNCAGGTGAFIDQMALCLGVEVSQMNSLAEASTQLYPIASRCGVFSKTDIQNLIARNVPQSDIAASIFRAVAVQTASALSHGCQVLPKVLMCGGPLTFLPELRKAIAGYFHMDYERDVVIEPNANVIPAWGSAISAPVDKEFTIDSLQERLAGPARQNAEQKVQTRKTSVELPAIFDDEGQYLEWKTRKAEAHIPVRNLSHLRENPEPTYLGIDSGSTTTKVVLMGAQGDIYFEYYAHNEGNPIAAVRYGL